MSNYGWKYKITEACKEAGTYEPCFDHVIDQLAQIMKMRDKAIKSYEKNGGEPTIVYENTLGKKNVVKNPALVVIMECNTLALSYWRDLGLTPKGLKALGEQVGNKNDKKSLGDVLSSLGI